MKRPDDCRTPQKGEGNERGGKESKQEHKGMWDFPSLLRMSIGGERKQTYMGNTGVEG